MPVLSLKQKEFLRSRDEWNCLSGSVRSGKTFIANARFMVFLENEAIPDVPVLLCSKKGESIERNIIEPLLALARNEGIESQFVRTRIPRQLIYKPKNIICYCEGANDEGAEGKIRGLTVQALYADEATLYPRSFLKQAIARCSAGTMYKIFTCNPESPEHWFYKEIYIKIGKEYPGRTWNFIFADNPVLTEAYKQTLVGMYSRSDYQRFVKGEWCISDAVVYVSFGAESIFDDYPTMYIREWICGIDWGFEHLLALVLIGVDGDGRKWITDEIAVSKQVVDNSLIRIMADKGWFEHQATAYCDSARPDQIEMMHNLTAPYHWTIVPADKSVDAGIDTVQYNFKNGLLKVSRDCTQTIQGLRTYQRKTDKDGVISDDVIKKKDDCVDAVRYAVHTYGPYNKDKIIQEWENAQPGIRIAE